jgi:hypothetical protein
MTLQRIPYLINAKNATIIFKTQRIKRIFAVKFATNDTFYPSKRQLAQFYLEY